MLLCLNKENQLAFLCKLHQFFLNFCTSSNFLKLKKVAPLLKPHSHLKHPFHYRCHQHMAHACHKNTEGGALTPLKPSAIFINLSAEGSTKYCSTFIDSCFRTLTNVLKGLALNCKWHFEFCNEKHYKLTLNSICTSALTGSHFVVASCERVSVLIELLIFFSF